MIEIIKAILFGIVEGITEWLPISSTGHMILLNDLIKLNVTDEFYSMFEVVIQLGAILEQLLSNEQYEKNVVTKKGSREVVEYAIKLPGDDGSPV